LYREISFEHRVPPPSCDSIPLERQNLTVIWHGVI
jgi:hypothetical protein